MTDDYPSYDRIPERMREPARRYVERGIIPGDFLQAVLSDSLTRAFGRADAGNKARMDDYVMWLYNDIPGACWGSRERIEEWSKAGGLMEVEV